MNRVGGGGIGGIGAPRVLYEDVAELEALKAEVDRAAPTRAAPVPAPGSVASLLAARAGRNDFMLDRPPLPPGGTRRPDGREMQLLLHGIVRKGRGAGGAEGRMVETVRLLTEARDRVQVALAEGRKA
jgi:hypothetical protein